MNIENIAIKDIKGTAKDVFLLRDGKKIPYNEVE